MNKAFRNKTGIAYTVLSIAVWICLSGLMRIPAIAVSDAPPLIVCGDMNFPPIEYLEDHEAKGLNVELWQALAEAMGRDVGIRLMPWEEAQQQVLLGEADALSLLGPTTERRKLYDFSDETLSFEFSLFIREDDMFTKSLDDLQGRSIGVTEAGYVRQILEPANTFKLVFIENNLQGFRLLESHDIDAVATDVWVGAYTIQKYGVKGIRILEEPFAVNTVGIAVKKGNKQLLHAINLGLRKLKNDGTLQQIVKQWSAKKVIFLTRETLQQIIRVSSIGLVLVVTTIVTLWIRVLRQTVRKKTLHLSEANEQLRQEIEHRKQAAEALRISERRLSTVMNNLPGMAYRCVNDSKWTMEFVSSHCKALTGYQPSDLIGNAVEAYADLIHPHDRDAVWTEVQAALAENRPFELEYRLISADGTQKYVWERGIGIDEHGQPLRLEGFISDITERQQAEMQLRKTQQALRDSERKMRAMLDAMQDMMFSIDPQYRLLSCNQAFQRALSEAGGKAIAPGETVLSDDYPESFRELWRTHYDRALAGEQFMVETSLQWADGMHRLENYLVPIYTSEGSVNGVAVCTRDVTEQKRAEKVLRDSELRYRALVENSGTSVLVIDKDGVYQLLNENAAAAFGGKPEDFIGKSLFDLLPTTVAEEYLEANRHIIETGEGHSYERTFTLPTGQKTFLIIDQAIRDSTGQGIALQSSSIDITERKRMEEALRESQMLLDATERLSKIGGWEWNMERQAMTWTAETYRIHEFTSDTLPSGSLEHVEQSLACYDPEDRGMILEAFQRCIAEGEPYDIQCPFTTASGRRLWIRTTAHAICEEKRICKVIGNIMDITERKQAEDALRESEEKYRLLVENLQTGVVMHAPDTRIVFANPEASRVLGLTADEMAGKAAIDPAWCFVREDGSPLPVNEYPVNIVCATLKPLKNQVFGINRPENGDLAWVLVTGYPVLSSDQTLEHVVITFIDISLRKRMEQQLRQLNVELEQRVQQRTNQLEAANQELEAFAYSVSHDLRAPLRQIDGFAQFLRHEARDNLTPEAAAYSEMICASAAKMMQLISDLLMFSRTARQELQTRPVDLNRLVREAQQEVLTLTDDRVIVWDIQPLPIVEADPTLLRMVMVNLLSNAVKYTQPRREARIEIGVASSTGTIQRRETCVYVRDNGVGFKSQYLYKLFGVFQRLHRAEEFEGTGIGLAMVRRIIHRHGGRVWAEGEVNQGAAFYLTLTTSHEEAP